MLYDLRPLLLLILGNDLRVEMFDSKIYKRKIFYEKLLLIHFNLSFKKLLIKIDGANTELIIVEIGGDHKNKVVSPHVAQQAHQTAFIELDEILSDALGIKLRTMHVML